MATEDGLPCNISLNNNIDWNVTHEVHLLHALTGHKPVGKTILLCFVLRVL